MTEVTAALVGIAAGALANGALQTWQQARERRLGTKVAARMILADLYIIEGMFERILTDGQWPEARPSFNRQLDSWREHRESLAAVLDAADWTLIAVAYQDLGDLPDEYPRGPLTGEQRATLETLEKRVSDAAETTARYAVPRRERDRVLNVIGGQTDN